LEPDVLRADQSGSYPSFESEPDDRPDASVYDTFFRFLQSHLGSVNQAPNQEEWNAWHIQYSKEVKVDEF
jgi:hypothetical protein